MKAKAPSTRHLPYSRNAHSSLLELSTQNVKSIAKLILMTCLVSKMSLALSASNDFVWTGGTCCGQNQPQFIHNPQALVDYFLSTPLPLNSPQASTFPSYTTCLAPPTAIGQSCYVYAWYTNIDYTSEANCPVSDLPPITDPAVQAFEDNPNLSDTADLTPRMQTALSCLQMAAVAGSPSVGSAYRPPAYNQHLIDVWNKWVRELKNNDDSACADLRTKIQTHFQLHGLLETQPPVPGSLHTQGEAVDVSINLPAANIDALANGCQLRRPVPVPDPVHFIHQ